MSELSFEQMLDESFKTIRNGEVVEGTVIGVKEDEIILNIGYKADGIISRNEYSNDSNLDLTTVVSVGDTMEAKVLKVNDGEGQVLLTYKRLAAEKGNKRLEEAFENKEVLTAKVTQVLDGGLSVLVEDTRVFIPASLVSDSYEKDLTKYQDQEIEFVITEFNPRRRRIIGDRKQLLVAKKAEMQKELFARIKPGDVVEGTIKNVTDFGAFIDLGGADGLLHISEMSWGRVENPKKVFKVGEKVKVLIKDIAGTKIALSLKFDDANPWNVVQSYLAKGTVLPVKIEGIVNGGAIAMVEGIRGFIPASRLSLSYIEDLESYLLKDIEVQVIDVDQANNRLVLSARELLKEKEKKEREEKIANIKVGSVLTGTVESLQNYGAFVRLEDGLSGLVHVSQISQKRIKFPKDVLNVGDEVQVKVIGVKDGKISLSMKVLEEAAQEEEEVKVEIPKSEDIGTSLGDLFKNIQL